MKQELEELRHEATVLLRERFHLQQCIRSEQLGGLVRYTLEVLAKQRLLGPPATLCCKCTSQ